MAKRFRLATADIRPLALGFGSCLASDRIPVDGLPVGYMYRESPDRPGDSGWRFLAGDESQEYLDDPSHLAIYDVNTIANYDSRIVSLLSASIGSAYERNNGVWVQAEFHHGTDA